MALIFLGGDFVRVGCGWRVWSHVLPSGVACPVTARSRRVCRAPGIRCGQVRGPAWAPALETEKRTLLGASLSPAWAWHTAGA